MNLPWKFVRTKRLIEMEKLLGEARQAHLALHGRIAELSGLVERQQAECIRLQQQNETQEKLLDARALAPSATTVWSGNQTAGRLTDKDIDAAAEAGRRSYADDRRPRRAKPKRKKART